ncbi:MAG TPA: fumarate hydratase, partial [Stellaceae bacterium]|nr:fumarate hydratase [Stellaceae bacterium]
MSDVAYHELFPLGPDDAPYRKLTGGHVSTGMFEGQRVVKVEPSALTLLARDAFVDCQHLLRPGHLAQLRAILDDPEASANDKFVAFDLLKNANIAAGKVLPMCQDTGTAIVMGKKGQQVWTGGDDAVALSAGICRTYTETNLRYSQVAPLSMYEEVNTGDNLPAQIDLYAEPGDQYKFLFIAKGGGSANKSFLYQQTKAVLNPKSLVKFLDEKLRTLGTAACPPYHLAIVIGGTSAEMNLKTVKLASCRFLDALPTQGNRYGQAYRDRGFEEEVLELTRGLGIGAQFGGKYFCH